MAKTYSGVFPVVTKTVNIGAKVGEMANKLAYPDERAEAKYPSGKPTAAYKSAIKKYLSNIKFWSAASRAGASCDVFVCTSVRASGADKNFPAGLWKEHNYMQANLKRIAAKKSNLKDGDIIIYEKHKALGKRRGHICIYYKGVIKEGSAKQWYGRTTKTVDAKFSMVNKKWIQVYRFKDIVVNNPISKGAKGTQVKRLQRYINWYYGKTVLRVDGIFGDKTLARVKSMQKKLGLKADGVVGKITLAKMKTVKR